MKSSSPSPLSCYVQQLVADIEQCKDNLAWPFIENTDVSPDEIKDWDEDYDTTPVRNLISWTGFYPEKLPPAAMLADEEVHLILSALLELLAACRAEAIFLLEVPERIQYEASGKISTRKYASWSGAKTSLNSASRTQNPTHVYWENGVNARISTRSSAGLSKTTGHPRSSVPTSLK